MRKALDYTFSIRFDAAYLRYTNEEDANRREVDAAKYGYGNNWLPMSTATNIVGDMTCLPHPTLLKSNLIFEIAGNAGAGDSNGHDQIIVDGDITLSGKIEVNALNGFIPAASDTFIVLTYTGSLSGNFINQDFDNAMPSFEVDFEPDFRQTIADSWPNSIN